MELLRRITLLLYGLALLALVSVVLLFPDTVADGLRSLADIPSTTRGAIAVVVGFIILIALYLMLRTQRYSSPEGLIVKTPGALADVSITSARDRILRAVQEVPNVVSADVKLQAPQGKADVDLAVEVAGTNINVPNKQKEIDRALRQVMLKQLGLQLANRPRVHIQLVTEDELRARDEAARAAVLPPPPPPAPATQQWAPAPPPETRSAAPVVAAASVASLATTPEPMVEETPVIEAEPVAAADVIEAEEPLPIEVEPTPIWDEPILPPEEETSQAETSVEPAPEADLPAWLTEMPVESSASEEAEAVAADEDIEPTAEADWLSGETLVEREADATADWSATTSADAEAATDVDATVLGEVETHDEEWRVGESSETNGTGLYAEDDESRRGENEPPAPLPDRE